MGAAGGLNLSDCCENGGRGVGVRVVDLLHGRGATGRGSLGVGSPGLKMCRGATWVQSSHALMKLAQSYHQALV